MEQRIIVTAGENDTREDCIAEVCRLASELCLDPKNRGPYQGRYVAHRCDSQQGIDEWVVLESDDPERYQEGRPDFDDLLDIFGHVTVDEVSGLGRARYWLQRDGTCKYDDEDPDSAAGQAAKKCADTKKERIDKSQEQSQQLRSWGVPPR